MAVTITDIAKKLQISPSAVSKILNGKGSFSPALRERVQATARELHYIPNRMAQNLQQKTSSQIGVIIPDITESFFAGVVGGIEAAFSDRAYSIFLCSSHEDAEKEKRYVDRLLENRVDGIILATVRHEIPADDPLFSGDIPVVFFDNAPKTEKEINLVTIDNFAAGADAARLLLENGHTEFAAIMGRKEESTGRLRCEGFLHALREAGISPREGAVKFCDFKEKSAYIAMQSLLKTQSFSALFIASSKMLAGAMLAIRESGRRIPEDISIVGFDTEDPYKLLFAPVCSVLQKEELIGRTIASLLLAGIGEGQAPKRVCIPHRFSSVGSIRKR